VVKDGCLMAIETTGDGDTEEDEVVTNVIKISSKDCLIISKGKGKQRAQGKRDLGLDQQSHHEHCLQTTVDLPADQFFSESSFQPYDDDLSDPDPDVVDDFNVGNNAKNVDDWVCDEHIAELSHKNPSKISEAMAIEVSSALSYPRDDTNTGLFTETDLDRCRSLFDTCYCWFTPRRCS
jgi:hypothetical protein